jgi:hypothetical protein
LLTAAHLQARDALSQTRRTMLGLKDPGPSERFHLGCDPADIGLHASTDGLGPG